MKGETSHVDDTTQGASIADLAVTFSPTTRDRFYTQVRWASANALNNRGDFFYAAYGGDLEDQVENVAGRDRDYLREAWYRRDTAIGAQGSAVDRHGPDLGRGFRWHVREDQSHSHHATRSLDTGHDCRCLSSGALLWWRSGNI